MGPHLYQYCICYFSIDTDSVQFLCLLLVERRERYILRITVFHFKQHIIHNQFLFSSVLTGRAEHQTTVFHIPLAHLVVISGVPPARRHPDLGHPVFWPGQIPLPHPGLLRHAHVSFTDCAPCCLTALVPLAPPVYHGFCCLPLFTVSSEITYWQETSQWIWDYCR